MGLREDKNAVKLHSLPNTIRFRVSSKGLWLRISWKGLEFGRLFKK